MPLFQIKLDGMGFTSEEDMTEQDLTTEEAATLTSAMRAAGKLPRGVVRVVQANVSPDGCDDGEWKVFVSVELVVEAASERAAEMLELPEDFLLQVADKMVDGDADSEYGVRGSFEVLEVYPADADEEAAVAQTDTASSSSQSILASQAVIGQWLVYENARMNQRIVDVSATRDGQIRIHADYGNGGEPATLFFDADEKVTVSTVAPSA